MEKHDELLFFRSRVSEIQRYKGGEMICLTHTKALSVVLKLTPPFCTTPLFNALQFRAYRSVFSYN